MSAQWTDDDFRELGITEEIPRVPWEEFLQHLHQNWEQGQHCSIFAPTEGGKTYLIRHGLLPLWQKYPVLWLRFKPRDRTMKQFGKAVKDYPEQLDRLKWHFRGEHSDAWKDDPEWFVIRLPPYRWSPSGKGQSVAWRRAREIAGTALDRAYREGGWVIVIDEIRAFTDSEAPGLDLKHVLENNWQRGRDQPLTIVAATQQPAWAPPSMYDQPRWAYFGRHLDVGRHERISEIGGDTQAIMAALPTLKGARQEGGPEFLAVDRWTGDMWIVHVEGPSEG